MSIISVNCSFCDNLMDYNVQKKMGRPNKNPIHACDNCKDGLNLGMIYDVLKKRRKANRIANIAKKLKEKESNELNENEIDVEKGKDVENDF